MDGPLRHKLLTSASRNAEHGENARTLQDVLWQLFAACNTDSPTDSSELQEQLDALREVLKAINKQSSRSKAQDAFRHALGLDLIVRVLKKISDIDNSPPTDVQHSPSALLNLLRTCVQVLSEALHEHKGNQRYLSKRVEGGWSAIEQAVLRISDPGPQSPWKEHHLNCAKQVVNILFDFALGKSLLGVVGDLPEIAGPHSIQDASPEQRSGDAERELSPVAEMTDDDQPIDDRSHHDFHSDELIYYGEVIAILFKIWCVLHERAKTGDVDSTGLLESILRRLHTLTTLSLRNRIAMHASGLLSSMLPLVLDDSLLPPLQNTFVPLALALAELGFTSLDENIALYKKASVSDAARDFLLRSTIVSKGPALIQFDLSECGYSSAEFPNLGHVFPPAAGYTFTAWIRIDQFDSTCHTTIFGTFDASQTCFVLAYLEQDSHQFILQTSVTASRPSVRFRSKVFEQGIWYHIALVHRYQKAPGSSRAALYVDGEFVEQVKCAYPEPPPLLQNSNEGSASAKSDSTKRKHVQAFFGTPQDLALRLGRNAVRSRWSLASAHLFEGVLSDELVAVYAKLGPRYNGNFQDQLATLLTYRASAELNRHNEVLHPEKSETSDILTATQNRGSAVLLESRVLLSISPLAVIDPEAASDANSVLVQGLSKRAAQRLQQMTRSGNSVMINAAVPAFNDALSHSYGVAVLTGQPVVALPQAGDDASWCAAGCIPLCLRLVESAQTKEALLHSVEVFLECIRDNWRISEAMEKENGYEVLGMTLRDKLGIGTWSPLSGFGRLPQIQGDAAQRASTANGILSLILGFTGYNGGEPQESLLVNPMAYRILLVDFDIWRRADTDTQRIYYAQFIGFLTDNKYRAFNSKRLRKMRIVRRLLEALKSDECDATILPNFFASLTVLAKCTPHAVHWDLAMFVAYALQDARAFKSGPLRPRISVAQLRHRQSQSTPSSPHPRGRVRETSQPTVSRAELGVKVLEMYTELLCSPGDPSHVKRFIKQVPSRWMLHLLAETDPRVIILTTKIIAHAIVVHGRDLKHRFGDKKGGFATLRSRLKYFWKEPSLWLVVFSMIFGRDAALLDFGRAFTLFNLVETFAQDPSITVKEQEFVPVMMSMLEAGLREVVRHEEEAVGLVAAGASTLRTVVQFLSDLQTRSLPFRDFAVSSSYVQELLFVLFPVVVGSDRVSAETELSSRNTPLTFGGQDVVIRPHSNSVNNLSTVIRAGSTKSSPENGKAQRAPPFRRTSSFVFVKSAGNATPQASAKFHPLMSPQTKSPVILNLSNSLVEALLEVVVAVLLDQICNRKDFPGFGLFLKVPPGFQEHQAYFESYVLTHTMAQLWNHLQLDQQLFSEPRVLTNLARYCLHMSEAVFEGWFIDGAQPLLDFTGKVLEYLQQPDVARIKSVRLCTQAMTTTRTVFLRIILLRLSELDDSDDEKAIVAFLHKMSYWQTILFSSDNQENTFLRLICYLLYLKLVSPDNAVRNATADIFRILLMQKPTETATMLTYNMDSRARHLATGFMKLTSSNNEEFIDWIDQHRTSLDAFFCDTLSRPWQDFVAEENRRTEESTKNRLAKRRERLKLWHTEETHTDNVVHRYEVSTNHWRSNTHAQERLKHQKTIQDQQENINHLLTVVSNFDKRLRQPCGIFPNESTAKWQLDGTEGRNRMRLRIVPDDGREQEVYQPKRKVSEQIPHKLSVDTRVARLISQDTMTAGLDSPSSAFPDLEPVGFGREHSASGETISSAMLESEFEIVDDPREDEDGFEDKNRKVMLSLQRGEQVQHLYNVSRIVGMEACEGLLVIGKDCLYLHDNFFQRSDGEIVSVSQAPTEERDPYLQMIAGRDTKDTRTRHAVGEQRIRHWTWREVLSISKRRFLFRDVAIEVFFTDGRSYLLTLIKPALRDELYGNVTSRAPHVHSPSSALAVEDAWRLDTLRNPEETPQTLGSKFASVFNSTASNVSTRKWLRGELSNFQYLMLVNTMAGRTFNDLTQYPVFPWVLADYTSKELDLTDPRSFRDLSKPMGCQNPARESEFRDRYRMFAEMGDHNAPAFHYGTHYSSAMIVTSYLIRLQPFVQSYLLLQGGSFDHADRLFDSIHKAWQSASRDNMTDVRELTPEFFYLPEFLMNINGYDFGLKQGSDAAINDVILPPWAKGDPHLFISKQREALESPYVSRHLHEWIDLIFGYKQRGEAALEATNVFHHLSYHGAKDLDMIDDPVERLATIGIIHNFGQTPHQVFQRAHHQRGDEKTKVARLDTVAETLTRLPLALLGKASSIPEMRRTKPDDFTDSKESVATLLYSPVQERLLCSSPTKLMMPPACDRYVQWGFADNSLRFFSSDSKKLLGLFEHHHIGAINTALFIDSKTLATASVDCTVAIWTVHSTSKTVELQPRTCLFGHRTSVTVLTASKAFSTLLSASDDGQVILWDLNRLNCVRVLVQKGGKAVLCARINSVTGHVLVCRGQTVSLYTLNGHLLLEQRVCEAEDDSVISCAFYEGVANEWLERELIFTGHKWGVVNIWSLVTLEDGAWHLQLIKRLNHGDSLRDDNVKSVAAITCILPMAQAVYTGDEDGKICEWNCVQRQSSHGGGRR
ncbi:Beige protein-like 1 [Elasticomyces elasticus]|nr:Beige protein-like 1 [Elasticomyces elasticus]